MNVRDDLRCEWTAGVVPAVRCMCPATMSTSRFCVFHRHPERADCAGIVAWSQEATVEEFVQHAKAFAYSAEPPHVARLREIIGARRNRRQAPSRQPGDDAEEAAA